MATSYLGKVKQEIAKEGVLPFSLFFASSSTVSNRPEATVRPTDGAIRRHTRF